MIVKSCKYILDLSHLPRVTEVQWDKNIISDVHKISQFLIHHRTYSFKLYQIILCIVNLAMHGPRAFVYDVEPPLMSEAAFQSEIARAYLARLLI